MQESMDKGKATKTTREMVERIYNELVGDEFTEGVIPKVNRIDKKVRTHTVLFRIVIGVATAIGFLLTVFVDLSKLIHR